MRRLLLILTIVTLSLNTLYADIKSEWTDFLKTAETIAKNSPNDLSYKKECEQFKLLLTDLHSIKALSFWQATVFYQKLNGQSLATIPTHLKETFVKNSLQGFASDYTPYTHSFIAELCTHKKSIARIKSLYMQPFATIDSAHKAWADVVATLINPLIDASFIKSFNDAPFVTKASGCDFLREAIDTCDEFIKNVKSSNGINWNLRVPLLKKMIDDFYTISKTFLTSIMPEYALSYHASWPLYTYLAKVETLKMRLNASANTSFQKSSRFSVDAALLGSVTAFERHYPETHEDLFMLIHQNSLVAIAATYGSLFANQKLDTIIDLPESLRDTIHFFETSSKNNSISLQKIGMHYEAGTIELFYNMPLRNHSSKIQVRYDRVKEECSLTIEFLGEARQRWEKIAFLGAVSPELSGLKLAKRVLLDTNAGITSCSWLIEKTTDLSIIIEYIKIMAELSYEVEITEDMLTRVHHNGLSLADTITQATNTYTAEYPQNPAIAPTPAIAATRGSMPLKIVGATGAAVLLGYLFTSLLHS